MSGDPDRRPILAIDQGGGSSRALLWSYDGELLATARREVQESRAAGGRVEQDPEELVRSLREAMNEVLASADRPCAAGLATQRSSLVFWDRETGEALSPVLSWQDTRAAEELASLLIRPGASGEISRRTGLRPSAHYGASKLSWGLRELPTVRRALGGGRLAAGPLAAFLAQRLTGGERAQVDVANASRTLLWNLAERRWDPTLLDLFGVPEEILPAVVPTAGAFGTLPETGVPLRVLTGDQGAVLFSGGPADLRSAWINLGTGAFLQRPLGEWAEPPPGLLLGAVADLGGHLVVAHEAPVNGCGSALRAYAEALGEPTLEAISGWLDEVPDPPLFLNGVSGLAAPYWRPRFRSRLVGDAAAPQQLAVAILESVLFLLVENLDRLDAIDPPERLVVTGGLAALDGLCQRLADLSRRPVERLGLLEATARGTACLVAGQPRWSLPTRRFEPHRDASLADRRRRWQMTMAEALANGIDR